jgi:hypothetical protein
MKKVRNIDISKRGEIYIDGMLFCNKPDSVDYRDSFQAIICEDCGYSGCELGNYVSLRKSKGFIYLTIQFEEKQWEYDEWTDGPSNDFLQYHNGIVCLTELQYERLRGYINTLPEIDKISKFKAHEILCLLQWSAPRCILGKSGSDICFHHELFLCSSMDDDKAINALNDLISQLKAHREPVEFKITEKIPISFYLDDNQFTEWKPIIQINNSFHIVISNDYIVII